MTPDEENRLLAKMFAASCVDQGRNHATYLFRGYDGLSLPMGKHVIVRFEVCENLVTIEPPQQRAVLQEAYE